jgi:hypothetical protein
MLSKNDVEDFATRALELAEEASSEAALLASARHESDEDVVSALRKLAEAEDATIENLEDYAEQCDRLRLGRLMVAWENSPHDESLLKEIAEIYADFGYPEDMRSCVYYMPPDGTNPSEVQVGDQLESPIAALERLLSDLKERLGAKR